MEIKQLGIVLKLNDIERQLLKDLITTVTEEGLSNIVRYAEPWPNYYQKLSDFVYNLQKNL